MNKDECVWSEDDGWVCPDPTADSTHTYAYDAAGSISGLLSSASGTRSGTYGAGNRIRSFDGCDYETNAEVNVVLRDCGGTVVSFGWSSDRRLETVTAGGVTTTPFYDARGRLMKRTVGSTTRYFLWYGGHLFAELDGSGNRVAEYSYYPGWTGRTPWG